MKTLLIILTLCLASCASTSPGKPAEQTASGIPLHHTPKAGSRPLYWTGGARPVKARTNTLDALRGAHEGRNHEYHAVADSIIAKSGKGPYSEMSLPPRGVRQHYTGAARVYSWREGDAIRYHAVREMGTVPGDKRNPWQGGIPATGFYSWKKALITDIPAIKSP